MSDQSLRGIRVLDLTRLMPFAYGTQLLADAGAEVVKVEAHGGEYGRGMPEAFRLTNRGKLSVEVDLRDPTGVAQLLELCRTADVLVESYRPGVLDRAGLGYAVVSEANPRIVYCSGSGYAAGSARAELPGHDLNYAALAGLTRLGDGPPSFPDTPYIDLVAGWGLASSVLLGLVEAARTGVGSHRRVAMADLALSLNVLGVAGLNRSAQDAGPAGPLTGYPWPDLMRGACPCYGTFQTRDGRFLALANVEPKFWAAFLEVVGRPDLGPHRFATGETGEWARREVAAVIAEASRDEWMARFAGHHVCVSDVLTTAEAVRDPDFADLVRTVDAEVVVSSPLSRAPRRPELDLVPRPGEHSEQILSVSDRPPLPGGPR